MSGKFDHESLRYETGGLGAIYTISAQKRLLVLAAWQTELHLGFGYRTLQSSAQLGKPYVINRATPAQSPCLNPAPGALQTDGQRHCSISTLGS